MLTAYYKTPSNAVRLMEFFVSKALAWRMPVYFTETTKLPPCRAASPTVIRAVPGFLARTFTTMPSPAATATALSELHAA